MFRESSTESAAKLLTILVVTALAVPAAAQRVEFEVASVKLHTSDDQRVMMVAQPGGRFVAANIPLRLLIRTAFQLQDDQIVSGPNWLATDRFDIEARAPEAAQAHPTPSCSPCCDRSSPIDSS